MSNTRLAFTNFVDSATILNGTGGGAPALDQTSPYTMAKVIVTDRYDPWVTANPPSGSPLPLDLDLATNRSVTTAAVLGYRPGVAGTSPVSSVEVLSSTAANGYPPVAGSSWTTRGVISLSGGVWRDAGTTFNSSSGRYWRFDFTNVGAQWSVGRVWLGINSDLGAMHSPGGIYSPFRNRLETPQPGGAVVLSDLGDPGLDITLPWNTINSTLKNTLLSMSQRSGSFLFLDGDDNFFEVFAVNGRVSTSRQYTSVFNADVQLKAMP
jgi:hypothetical protein